MPMVLVWLSIAVGGPCPAVSPGVTDETRLPTQDLLGEKRLANLSEEKSPEVLSLEAFTE